jgi:DNA-binding LytR/AlgR family response regulator
MARGEKDQLEQILRKLNEIEPPVRKFPVMPEDPAMAVYFLELADVCYVTTRTEHGREEIMFVTRQGKKFYSNLRLSEVEERLADHPYFLRSSKFYIINLRRIVGLKVSSSRDLWFEGLDEPVINAVTSTYLEDFEKRFP